MDFKSTFYIYIFIICKRDVVCTQQKTYDTYGFQVKKLNLVKMPVVGASNALMIAKHAQKQGGKYIELQA